MNSSFTWTSFWNWLNGNDPGLMSAVLANQVLAMFDSTVMEQTDLTEQLDLYKGLGNGAERGIVVAHSQGTFFANLVYDQLTASEQGHIKVYGAAVVASRIPGGAYTTLTADQVVSYTDWADWIAGLPRPLPANTANTTPPGDSWGHDFVDTYLAGDVSGDNIITYVVGAIRNGAKFCVN